MTEIGQRMEQQGEIAEAFSLLFLGFETPRASMLYPVTRGAYH